MRRPIITAALLGLLASAAWGKTVRRRLQIFSPSVPETETIAPETMEFVYDYAWCNDTTGLLKEEDAFTRDQMLLQIGPGGLSKFSSFKNLTVDSMLMRSTKEQIVDAAIEGKLSRGEFMTIFKNHPAGTLVHTEQICRDWFRYDEEMPAIRWELADSVATVLGYECHAARCTFRGRQWTVLFAEDIPVMDGPWKLHGLPGLIMKAADAEGHYSFECVGIRSAADRPITIYKVPFNKTDRSGYYDTKHRYETNPYAYFEATTGDKITVTDEAGDPTPGRYDPAELTYDYIERDWRR